MQAQSLRVGDDPDCPSWDGYGLVYSRVEAAANGQDGVVQTVTSCSTPGGEQLALGVRQCLMTAQDLVYL